MSEPYDREWICTCCGKAESKNPCRSLFFEDQYDEFVCSECQEVLLQYGRGPAAHATDNTGEAMKAIYAAFVKAQAELGVAIKDSTNPHFKSRYADLSSVVAAVKPVFAKHGLAYIQKFAEAQGGVAVETVVVHETGEQFSTGVLFVPATKQDAQGYGSAITYARRYSLQTAAGIPADDDDGNAASASAPKFSSVKSALAELDGESMVQVQIVADAIVEAVAKGDDKAVFALAESLDSDQRVYLWSLWQDDSKLRSKVKRIVDTMRQVAAQAAPEKVAA